MVAELSLLSLTHLQTQSQPSQPQPQPHHQQQQLNPNSTATGSWMWNPKQETKEDEESWEVRAFEEDTSNIMGTTWPPRSYTCTFCRREFRSAQALGGHMNVHRRDRARLHQTPPPATTSTSSTLIFPTQEFVANGSGLCLLYSLPNPNIESSPSTLLSISPYPPNGLMPPNSMNFPVVAPPPPTLGGSALYQSEPTVSVENNDTYFHNNNRVNKEAAIEDLDLELRLGRRGDT